MESSDCAFSMLAFVAFAAGIIALIIGENRKKSANSTAVWHNIQKLAEKSPYIWLDKLLAG